MRDGLFLVDGDRLTALRPSAPPDEERLQDLLARHSALLGEDLLLVTREQPVADAEDGAGRWSLDHLFVTRDAVPVLVEVKRAGDTRLRREVIGQLLDYAANGAAFWTAAELAAPFTAEDEAARLDAFLDPEDDPATFWASVEANLRAGRMRLLIVADRIPPELARVVEFLNALTLPDTEVLAVELRWFEAGDGRLTLAPRTIGQTEAVKARKAGTGRRQFDSVEDWLDAHFGDAGNPAQRGAEAWVELMAEFGATLRLASTGGSVQSFVSSPSGRPACVFTINADQRIAVTFGGNKTRGALADRAARQVFFDRFKAAAGSLSTNADGWPTFPAERLADPKTLAAFREVARDWVNACREAADAPAAGDEPC